MVEFVFLLHSFFERILEKIGVRTHESLAFTPAFLILILLWTLPGFLALYFGYTLLAIALGVLGLYAGVEFTLKAVGTHL
jgi:membrane protein implicated in regulation of membrane protease activity